MASLLFGGFQSRLNRKQTPLDLLAMRELGSCHVGNDLPLLSKFGIIELARVTLVMQPRQI